jgi:hypothetical protein
MSDQPVYYKMCPECQQEIERKNWSVRGVDEFIKTDDRHREYMKVKREAERSALFPAPLRTLNRHCPRHQSKLASDVARIAANRLIPVEWFDAYDANGVHVCRACGAKLLTKKGKPAAALRWCQAPDDGHYKLVLETLFNFASRRSWYIHELATRQVPEMRAKHADKIASGELEFWGHERTGSKNEYFKWTGDFAILCEGCGKLVVAGKGGGSFHPGSDVHHKNPVCQVTLQTVMSIFDSANFIALCSTCHGGSHPWRKKPEPPPEPITLDSFLKK